MLQNRITTQGDPYSYYREWVFSVSRDVNFACKIHPAAQNDIGEQQWVTGFHNELSLWVKCCTKIGTISIGANTVRPSVDCRWWWYHLRGGNINMARPSTFLKSRSWWGHECGEFIYFFRYRVGQNLYSHPWLCYYTSAWCTHSSIHFSGFPVMQTLLS